MRKPLIDFIQNQLAPADMVAIMYPLTPITGLTFTRNRASLISAIEHFQGRRFDYQPRNEFEERYAYYPASTVEQVRNQVVMTALKGAAARLGGLREGRKSIIFVSEGFTTILPPQLNDPVAAMPGMAGQGGAGRCPEQRPGGVVGDGRHGLGHEPHLHGDEPQQHVDLRRRSARAWRRSSTTSIRASACRSIASTSRWALDTLRALADNTDGRAIVNRNDSARAMQQIIRDASGYYLIGYNSSQAPTDGKFHKIDVEVTRKGVDVRARKGYWAYTAEDAARAEAPRAEAPAAVTAALAHARRAAARPSGALLDRHGARRERQVEGHVCLGADSARAGRASSGRRGRLARDADGARARRPAALPRARARAERRGAASDAAPGARAASATFDVPPGRMQLRMTVQNAGGQVMDSSTNDVTVPDYTTPQVSFGTPRLFRARTPRDVQAIKANPAPGAVERSHVHSHRAAARPRRRLRARDRAAARHGAAAEPRRHSRCSTCPCRRRLRRARRWSWRSRRWPRASTSWSSIAKAEAGAAQEIVAFRVR